VAGSGTGACGRTALAGTLGTAAGIAGHHFHRTVRLRDMVALLRVHQWVKNVLVFVPLVLAHRMELSLWGQAAAAALALSLWASALYV